MSRKSTRGRGELHSNSISRTAGAAEPTAMPNAFAAAAKSNPFGLATRASASSATTRGSNPFSPRGAATLQRNVNPFDRAQTNGFSGRGTAGTPVRGSARGSATGRATTRGANRGTSRGVAPRAARRGVQSARGNLTAPSSKTGPFAARRDETNIPPEQRLQFLKVRREKERADAITNGLMADPDIPRDLSEAITLVGTCQDMCPEYERVTRIVQNDVRNAECVPETVDRAFGEQVPDESRMVKKFRRPAAGIEEQIPSDLRPPKILRTTLDYLVDRIVGDAETSDALAGGQSFEKLKAVHNFVWDRTRSIRNDFSVQQVRDVPNLIIAIDCFERIVRFHILTRHKIGGKTPSGEGYDHQQDLEQCIKALVSLITFYDLARSKGYKPPNEPEFRAYWIITRVPEGREQEVESKVQKWPKDLQRHPRVGNAMELYAAGCNALNPRTRVQAIGQASYIKFWNVVRSPAVSYLMACTAEIFFDIIRKCALFCIASAYSRARGRRADEWSSTDLMKPLALDTEDEVFEYVEAHGLSFVEREDEGVWYLDLSKTKGIQYSQIAGVRPPKVQYFSRIIVEAKRLGRTLPAIINGYKFQEASERGLIKEEDVTDMDMNEDYLEQEAQVQEEEHHHLEEAMDNAKSDEKDHLASVTDDASALFVRNEQEAPTLTFAPHGSSSGDLEEQSQVTGLNLGASLFNPFTSIGSTTTPQPFEFPSSAPSATGTYSKPSPTLGNALASNPFSGFSTTTNTLGESIPGKLEKTIQADPSPSKNPFAKLSEKTSDSASEEQEKESKAFSFSPNNSTASAFVKPIALTGSEPSMPTPAPVDFGPSLFSEAPKSASDPASALLPVSSFTPATSLGAFPSPFAISQPSPGPTSHSEAPPFISPPSNPTTELSKPASSQWPTSQTSQAATQPKASLSLFPKLESSNPPSSAPLEGATKRVTFGNTPTKDMLVESPTSSYSASPARIKHTTAPSNSTLAPESPLKPPKGILKNPVNHSSQVLEAPFSSTALNAPALPQSQPIQSKPAGPTPRQRRREDCLDYLARQLLLDPKEGILYQYVAYAMNPIFHEVKLQVDEEKRSEKLEQLRRTTLIRKFGGLWRTVSNYNRKRLQAYDRRQRMLAASARGAQRRQEDADKRNFLALEYPKSASQFKEVEANAKRLLEAREQQRGEVQTGKSTPVSKTLPLGAPSLTGSPNDITRRPPMRHRRNKSQPVASMTNAAATTPGVEQSFEQLANNNSESVQASNGPHPLSGEPLRNSENDHLFEGKRLSTYHSNYFRLKARGLTHLTDAYKDRTQRQRQRSSLDAEPIFADFPTFAEYHRSRSPSLSRSGNQMKSSRRSTPLLGVINASGVQKSKLSRGDTRDSPNLPSKRKPVDEEIDDYVARAKRALDNLSAETEFYRSRNQEAGQTSPTNLPTEFNRSLDVSNGSKNPLFDSSVISFSSPQPTSRRQQQLVGTAGTSLDVKRAGLMGLAQKSLPAYWMRESKFVPRSEYGLGHPLKRARVQAGSTILNHQEKHRSHVGSSGLSKAPAANSVRSRNAAAATLSQVTQDFSTETYNDDRNGSLPVNEDAFKHHHHPSEYWTADLLDYSDGQYDETSGEEQPNGVDYGDDTNEEDAEADEEGKSAQGSEYDEYDEYDDDEEDDEEDGDGRLSPSRLQGGNSAEDAIEL